jgi:hypothetical protein
MTPESVTGTFQRDRADSVPTATLLSRLRDDATALIRNELALAKSEFMESVTTLKLSLTAMAGGAIVLLCGVLTLIAAAVLGLSLVIAAWAAALIVGVVLTLVGYVMIRSAKSKFADPSLTLRETKESLRKDAALAARREP